MQQTRFTRHCQDAVSTIDPINFKGMIKLIQILAVAVIPLNGVAQRQLSEADALVSALKNSASLKASSLEIIQKRQLQMTAYNLDNPEVLMQSPTGEFQTVGVMQSIRFPTVYLKQNQLYKQQTELSQVSEKITIKEITYRLKSLYLDHQYKMVVLEAYTKMDSIFAQIKQSTEREFAAGTIDYLEKALSDSKYGEIHNKLAQAKLDVQLAQFQLQTFTGITEEIRTDPLSKATSVDETPLVHTDSTLIQTNPVIEYWKQQQVIAQKTFELERNKALPGLTFGYLNQAGKNTPSALRFQFGLTIPIWFWQYRGNIQAAKSAIEISEQTTANQQQLLTLELEQAIGTYRKHLESLQYFETIGLMQSEEIISVSKRFFEAGKDFDYINYLRTISDAYMIEFQYLETLKNHNQSLLNISYVKGSL